MNENDGPKRRFTIELEVGGDTLADAVSMLRHFIEQLRKDARACCSGGYSRSGTFKVVERPDMTHDAFEAELEKWLEDSRHAQIPPDATAPR